MRQIAQNIDFSKMETFDSPVYKQHVESIIKLGVSFSYGFRRQLSKGKFREYNFTTSALGISYPCTVEPVWEIEANNFLNKHGIYDEFPTFRGITTTIAPGKIAWWFPYSSPDLKRLLILWSLLIFLYAKTQKDEMVEHETVENDCLDQIEELVCSITGNCRDVENEPRSILRAFNELAKELKKIRSDNSWVDRWVGNWRIWINSLKTERDLLRKKVLTGKYPECIIIYQLSIWNSGILNVLVMLDHSMEFQLPEDLLKSDLTRDIQTLTTCILIYQNAISSSIIEKGKLNLIHALCEQFGISISEAREVIMQMHTKAVQDMTDKCELLLENTCQNPVAMNWIALQKGFIAGMAKYQEEMVESHRYYSEIENQL